MKKPILKPLLTFLLFCIFFNSYNQNDTTDLRWSGLQRNAIYVTFGSLLLYYAVEVSYERLFFENQKLTFGTFWVNVSGGKYVDLFNYEDGGPYYSISITTMTGANEHHFEVNGGMGWMYDKFKYESRLSEYHEYIDSNPYSPSAEPSKSDYRFLRPAGSMGYRYQEPNGFLIIRAGIGHPESLYLSFAVCF